jgi:hypothetical protein
LSSYGKPEGSGRHPLLHDHRPETIKLISRRYWERLLISVAPSSNIIESMPLSSSRILFFVLDLPTCASQLRAGCHKGKPHWATHRYHCFTIWYFRDLDDPHCETSFS